MIGEEVYNKKETHVPDNEQTFAKNPRSTCICNYILNCCVFSVNSNSLHII